MLAPVVYLPHGGGPMPLLGDPAHRPLIEFLRQLPQQINRPDAILIISAHWEEIRPTINNGATPGMYYDYGGFPEQSYRIQYPAPGSPGWAQEIHALLRANGVEAGFDSQRGYDHGVFVPLKLMYPGADIPIVQLSLVAGLDAEMHIALGEALSSLRNKNVLIIGSGMSFHNLRAFFIPGMLEECADVQFTHWLVETCTSAEISADDRRERLVHWDRAPAALDCHPRAEHLLPLHVCFGIASAHTPLATVVFNQPLMGSSVVGLMW